MPPQVYYVSYYLWEKQTVEHAHTSYVIINLLFEENKTSKEKVEFIPQSPLLLLVFIHIAPSANFIFFYVIKFHVFCPPQQVTTGANGSYIPNESVSEAGEHPGSAVEGGQASFKHWRLGLNSINGEEIFRRVKNQYLVAACVWRMSPSGNVRWHILALMQRMQL